MNDLIKKFVFVPVLLLPLIICAQDSLKKDMRVNRFGFGCGVGIDKHENNSSLNVALSVDYNIQRNAHLFGIGYHSSDEFGIIFTPKPNARINSYEITYGRVITKSKYFTTLSGGLSYNFRIERGKYIRSDGFLGPDVYEKLRINTIGVPVMLRRILITLRNYGIGLELYANFNTKSYYCISIVNQFGKVK